MEKMSFGDVINVQAYKQDGRMYRQWNGLKIIEISPDNTVLFGTKTKVAEDNGQKWIVREPVLWFFSKKHFYNTTILLRESGSYFYTNLSSPYIFEDGTIKYIDYDLDIKMYPKKDIKIVDKKEYEENSVIYDYSDKLMKIIEKTKNNLIQKMENRDIFFNYHVINTYVEELKDQKLIKKSLKINKDKSAY